MILAAGRPGFVAKRRDASGEDWLAANGRGYRLDPASPVARAEYCVIGDAQGSVQGARITAAASLAEADLRQWFGERIELHRTLRWVGQRVEARREERLGALVLSKGSDAEPDIDAVQALLVDKALDKLRSDPGEIVPPELLARARFAGVQGLSPESLRQSADLWLAPLLAGRRDLAVGKGKLVEAVLGMLDWEERQRLDKAAPGEFTSPAGTRHPIDYTGQDAPAVEVRVQALFGLDEHPMVGRTPLLLKLTSPAGRPVQATRDLPAFWRGSWADVRKDMKGRYPKHRWPEEPWTEAPSLKTKNAFSRSGG